MYLVLILLACAAVAFLVFSLTRGGNRAEELLSNIPIPPPSTHLPVIAHVFDMIGRGQSPWDVLTQWIRQTGPVLRFRFFNNHYVVLADLDVIKHIFHKSHRNYPKDDYAYAPFMCLLGNGLVTSHGDLWSKQRRLIAPAFRLKMLAETAKIACAATDRLAAKLDALIAQSKDGVAREVELGEEFRRLTLQVIGESVLSLKPEESDEVFPELYLPIVDEANLRTWYPFRSYLPTPQNFRYLSAVRRLNAYVSAIIKDRIDNFATRKQRPEETWDILDRIIGGVEGETLDANSVEQLRDEVKTFLFAGHETSSMMLTWTLYEAIVNPECMQRILEEANAVFHPELNGALPSYQELDKLSYTLNALKEALRKYSVVPVVTREALVDDSVGEYNIPKGTKVIVPIQAIHHDEKLWPEPDKFAPERFEKELPHKYAFLGFINGPRNCIGQNFALLEGKVVLALLVQRYEITASPKLSGEKHRYKIPVCPLNGLLADVRRRG